MQCKVIMYSIDATILLSIHSFTSFSTYKLIIACRDLLASYMTGVIASQEVALQRAAGMLHDRQLFAVQLPGLYSHQQCTGAIRIAYLTAFA